MTIPILSAHFNPNINLSLRVHNSSGLNNRPLAELEIALEGIMASKRTVFSAFTVESLLSSDHLGEKNNLRQEDEEAPKSADKESDSGGSFCTGNCFLHLLLLIYILTYRIHVFLLSFTHNPVSLNRLGFKCSSFVITKQDIPIFY